MTDVWEASFPKSNQISSGSKGEKGPKAVAGGFTLRVNFRGICCFVPAPDGLSMGVFLVNEGKQGERKEIPAHNAAVRFRLSQVKGVTGVPNNLFSTYLPTNEEIRFDFEGNDGGRKLEIAGFRDGSITEQPLEVPTESLWWLLSVSDALRKRGMGDAKVDGRFTSKILGPDEARVLSARFMLTRGKIKSDRFIRFDDSSYVVWRLKPEIEPNSEKDHLQFAASVVQLECPVSADSLRIMARDLRREEERQIVELVPNRDRIIEINVLNEESDEILEVGSPPNVEIGVVRGQDKIFKSALKLLADPPEEFEFPIPVASRILPPRRMRGRDGGVRSAYPCSPLRIGG